MKVAINTNYKAAGTKVCVDDLMPKLIKAGHKVVRNDWDNYEKYNLILFMNPDSDVSRAKKINPKAIVGIMDPKLKRSKIKNIKLADFLLVSSIEQRDIFLKYQKNIFIYYMFPDIKPLPKEHKKKDKIIVGYHGNKTHLNCMADLSKTLDELTNKYKMEFCAMYNMEKLGKWKKNLPKKCPVKHIQWSEKNYYKYLSQSDIGVIPAKIPINLRKGRLATRFSISFLTNRLRYNKEDYLVRFKYSTNPGRIYPFSQLYIPVVAEFMPSYCQVIQDGYSGFLVYSKEGWYDALEKLMISPDLRNKMSKNLKNFIDNNCSPDINFKKFLNFLNLLKTKK